MRMQVPPIPRPTPRPVFFPLFDDRGLDVAVELSSAEDGSVVVLVGTGDGNVVVLVGTGDGNVVVLVGTGDGTAVVLVALLLVDAELRVGTALFVLTLLETPTVAASATRSTFAAQHSVALRSPPQHHFSSVVH